MATLAATVVALAIATFVVWKLLSIGHRPKDYPPGPPTLPIIGNLHQMPVRDAHLQFQKWAKEYGPVYSLILGTKTLVVLSSDKAIKDLLDKRSNIHSHRPDMYIGQTLCSGNLRVLMMGYTKEWRTSRKLIHGLLNISIAKSYIPYQMLENRQMLYEMLKQPDNFLQNIRRYSNALTTTMVFGWRTATYEDDKMQQLFDGFSQFAELNQTGTAALIDFFPIIRRLPDRIVKTQKIAKELHEREKALYLSHWLQAKKEIERGTINPCFCESLASVQKAEDLSDDQAAYISGTLLEAGSDTTSSTLCAFIQAMLLFPEVQKKAHDELDRVIGAERLPTIEDDKCLPYIRACMKETLRWMPTTLLGAVPHAVTKDDWYEGHRIPKGAGVMNNVWSINMDPERHPNPRQYQPERYIDDNQSLADAAANPDPKGRDQFTFGAGRRICPGMHVAERSLFLAISRFLWAFKVEPKLAANGDPMMPDPDRLTQGFVCMPEEFECSILPRDSDRAERVAKEWEEEKLRCLDPSTLQWKVNPI